MVTWYQGTRNSYWTLFPNTKVVLRFFNRPRGEMVSTLECDSVMDEKDLNNYHYASTRSESGPSAWEACCGKQRTNYEF